MKSNWQTKSFEDCIEKIFYTDKIQRKNFLVSGTFPIISQESEYINGYWNNERNIFRIKTPVIIFGDHTQVIKYVDFDFVLGADGVKILQPKTFLDPKFFYYFLKNIDLKNLGYARHYRLLKEVIVKFPKSILEQQRIVSVLDKVFEKTAEEKELAEKNLQNAHELFESYLQSIFDNPKDWEKKKLGEVLQKTETINPLMFPDKEFMYIDVSSVNNNDFSIENTTQIKGKDAPSRARKLVMTNDVIFATVRPTLKRIAIIPEDLNQQICSTGYFVLRTREQLCNKLVFYFIQTRAFQDNMEKIQKGASYPAVTDNDIRNQIILYPKNTIEQTSIIVKLDSLSIETKKLKKIYEQKLVDLEEFNKTVLQKAFNGELID